MADNDLINELLSKITDADLKAKLETSYKGVNQERATALMDLKTQKDLVRSQGEDLKTMAQMAEAFKASGVKVESNQQMIDLVKQLGGKVDDKSTVDAMNAIIEENKLKMSDYESRLRKIDVESKMVPLLNELRKEFKDADGKPYYIIEDYIDKEMLTKDIDPSVEVLANKRAMDVLEAAKAKTIDFMTRNKFEVSGAETHKLPNTDNGITSRSQGIINQEQLMKDWDRPDARRDVNQAAQHIAAIRAARTKQE